MMRRRINGTLALILIALAWISAPPSAPAQTETVLYNFCSRTNCTDGDIPYAGLIRDDKGSLFGTTRYGGTKNNGIVFVLSSKGIERVLHKFVNDGKDGFAPNAGLVMDSSGNLYGTTYEGGAHDNGTVFKISPDRTETVLHSFGADGSDGFTPDAGLIIDANGNLYGTTFFGGVSGYYGTVFEISATGIETILYSFAGYPKRDGANPSAGLVLDENGNLYGTTQSGGAYGYGTVFELSADGTETVLHSFSSNGVDGIYPYAGLLRDAEGRLYGTTFQGGANNVGTAFEVETDGKERILHSFGANSEDGIHPYAGLVADKHGNLYGTTAYGGANGSNFGTVFRLNARGEETILHSFAENGTDGYQPFGGLVMDCTDTLYGTTAYGGTEGIADGGAGTIFKLKP
jgi:uncharacterized repeat protein (TIGR03803 family)